MDIMHDVTDELSTGEIYHLLARRVARALGLSQCSVVLTKLGGPPRVAAYAYETGINRDFVLDLDKYPELKTALETGRPVLVENVMVEPALQARAGDVGARRNPDRDAFGHRDPICHGRRRSRCLLPAPEHHRAATGACRRGIRRHGHSGRGLRDPACFA